MGIIVSACPTFEHVSADAEHVSTDTEHVSTDAEHVSTGAEVASADTEHVYLSVGTVLAFAIHAFCYLAINEESHSDTVMMSEWLSSFYMIRCINTLLRLRLQPPCSGLRGRCRRWCDSFLP